MPITPANVQPNAAVNQNQQLQGAQSGATGTLGGLDVRAAESTGIGTRLRSAVSALSQAISSIPNPIKNAYNAYVANQEAKALAKQEAAELKQTQAVDSFVGEMLNGDVTYESVVSIRSAFRHDFWSEVQANPMFDAIKEGLTRAGCSTNKADEHMRPNGLVLNAMKAAVSAEGSRIDAINEVRKQKFETSYDLVSKAHVNTLTETLTAQEQREERREEVRLAGRRIASGTATAPFEKVFTAFATKEFSVENVKFLQAARVYAATTNDAGVTGAERREMLQDIINNFTDFGVRNPDIMVQDINISSSTRNNLKGLVEDRTGEIRPGVALTGQELRSAVGNIARVVNDTTIRFLQTEAGKTYIETGQVLLTPASLEKQ